MLTLQQSPGSHQPRLTYVAKVPELRILYDHDGKTALAELDAVVRVKKGLQGVMYVGSTKTFCDGGCWHMAF